MLAWALVGVQLICLLGLIKTKDSLYIWACLALTILINLLPEGV